MGAQICSTGGIMHLWFWGYIIVSHQLHNLNHKSECDSLRSNNGKSKQIQLDYLECSCVGLWVSVKNKAVWHWTVKSSHRQKCKSVRILCGIFKEGIYLIKGEMYFRRPPLSITSETKSSPPVFIAKNTDSSVWFLIAREVYLNNTT